MLSNIHPKYHLAVCPKNQSPYNPTRSKIDGSVATIIDLPIGERGWFVVVDEYDYWHRIHTSIVEAVNVDKDGNVTLNTANTIYTFKKIN